MVSTYVESKQRLGVAEQGRPRQFRRQGQPNQVVWFTKERRLDDNQTTYFTG